MRSCTLCKKKFARGTSHLFAVPKDLARRTRWGEICGRSFVPSNLICIDHFLPTSIVQTSKNMILLPNAEPFPERIVETICFQKNASRLQTCPKKIKKSRVPEHKSYEAKKGALRQNLFNINNNVPPTELQTSPILQIPLFKTDSKTTATQTNTRFCGTIQVSEFVDEYRINCFYCWETFPLEKWKKFEMHMKEEHIDYEEAFKIHKYASDDHDYTPIASPTPTPVEINPIIQQTLVIEADSLITYILESLDSMTSKHNAPVANVRNNNFLSKTEENAMLANDNTGNINNFVNSNSYDIKVPTYGIETKFNDSTKTKTSYLPQGSKNEKKKPIKMSYSIKVPTNSRENEFNVLNDSISNAQKTTHSSESEKRKEVKKRAVKKSTKKLITNTRKSRSKQKVISSGILFLQNTNQQTSNKTALSRCLKRSNTIEIKEELEPSTIDSFQPVATELSFEYTPRDIIDFMLENMRNYPVLWEFDEHPFNEDYYEAIEELCRIINIKWSMNIDNLKMRRSINRVLRFYCSVYPLENVENIDQFTSFYDKCAAFLPKSVNDIAYARCSHCYRCYKNDSDLKAHLLEELKHLQWPYKCVQCKECFRDSDEYEFHKRLTHYKEIFRCEQCNKRFLHRNKFNRHMFLHQVKESDEPGKYVCKVCDKAFKSSGELRNHKIYHGEKKHQCHLCPKSYYTNATLRHHLKSHNKEYDLMCEVCGKGFIHHTNLREHMKKHTGAKITCNICNLKLRKSSLMRHLRTVHVACEGTIESTYRARCHNYKRILRPMQKRYRYRNKYKEKNYFCKICNIRFEGYKFIVQHNKDFHSDYPKLPCKMCGTEFRQKINLNRHYRQKHMLHSYQVYKLVELDEDVSTVLAIKTEELEKLTETLAYSLNGPSSSTETYKHTTIIKSDPSPDEIYIEEERLHSDTIQDQIMKVADNIAPHEIKVDDDHYMNDFFTNLLK